MKKILLLFFIFLFVSSSFCFADTPTDTPTATETLTETITPTFTETPTITFTSTITPTYTNSPTPQASVFAYPNPAAFRDNIFIAYPSKTGNASDLKRVIITVYSINGDYVAQIVDDTPNGYTEFKIDKLARGTYFYKVLVRYNDGTEEIHKYKKFAIIK
jgi:hypothetical protein